MLDKLATWDTDTADSGVESEDETERSALWVQRFQPRSYVELLSDEVRGHGTSLGAAVPAAEQCGAAQ